MRRGACGRLAVGLDRGRCRGHEAVRPYADTAPALRTLVDPHNRLGAAFGARVVPKGICMEADGRIAWAKIGGFSVDHSEDLAHVKAFLAGEALPPPPVVDRLDSLRGGAIATPLRLADVLLDGGAREQALAELRRALSLDPDNFIVQSRSGSLPTPSVSTLWSTSRGRNNSWRSSARRKLSSVVRRDARCSRASHPTDQASAASAARFVRARTGAGAPALSACAFARPACGPCQGS